MNRFDRKEAVKKFRNLLKVENFCKLNPLDAQTITDELFRIREISVHTFLTVELLKLFIKHMETEGIIKLQDGELMENLSNDELSENACCFTFSKGAIDVEIAVHDDFNKFALYILNNYGITRKNLTEKEIIEVLENTCGVENFLYEEL